MDVGSIEIKNVIDLVQIYDGSLEDFEKVFFIEDIALPIIRENTKDSSSEEIKPEDRIKGR